MRAEEIEQYRDYPEGSVGKKLYDGFHMPVQEFYNKYYSNPDSTDWKRLLGKYIYPAFDENKRTEYVQFLKQAGAPFLPDFNKLDTYWKELKNDSRFDDELKYFFAFLGGAGFFDKYNLTLETWLNAKNWYHPYGKATAASKTILEMLAYDFGANVVKHIAPDMPWVQGKG